MIDIGRKYKKPIKILAKFSRLLHKAQKPLKKPALVLLLWPPER